MYIFFLQQHSTATLYLCILEKNQGYRKATQYDNLDMSTCGLHHTFTASNHIQSQWWCAWASGSDPWLRTIILIITIWSLSKHKALVGLVPTNHPCHSDNRFDRLSNLCFLFRLMGIALLICLIAIVRWYHRRLYCLTENHDNEFVSYS